MTTNPEDLNLRALELFERALDQPAASRIAWITSEASHDTELREKALNYLARDSQASAAMKTGGAFHDTLDDTAVPDQIGAYKIIGLIGRGGMGAVYRGERASGDFDHDVAIKVVRPGAMSGKLVARFENERQTLAKLSHPHIARLYDGGTLGNGAPYIVMEFIDGLPITEWADTHKADYDARLNLFHAACTAVQYAHQNLIIHRDITPSNVLVNAAGQVKLIDFGIAKPFDEDAAITDTINSLASLSFTPGFAAPERSKGAGANTLSDIYSLGRLLRRLTADMQNNADMDAIITKATQPDPGARYASVDALIDDLNNLKANFPVDARDGGAGYRFKKLISRRKLAASLTSLVAIGLVGGLITITALYNQTRAAKISAESRFAETRELTSFLLNDLTEDLEALPGTLPVLGKVRETSGKYLDVLSKAAQNNPELRYEYAVAEARMGEIKTAAGGANLGDPNAGKIHMNRSLDILNALAKEPGATADVFNELGDTQFSYGYTLGYHFGDYKGGVKYMEESIKNNSRAIELDPNMEAAWVGRVRARLMLFYANEDEWSVALENWRSLKAEYEDLRTRFPGSEWFNPQYASFLRNAANYKLDHWDVSESFTIPDNEQSIYDEGIEELDLSLDIIRAMIAESPAHPEHLYQFIWSQEIKALLVAMPKSWVVGFEDSLGLMIETFETGGSSAVQTLLATHPAYVNRKARYASLTTDMDQSDRYLEQLAPFDAEAFSHIEAVYYNLKARAYMEVQLASDYNKGLDYFDQALSMAKAYQASDPDLAVAHTEVLDTLSESIYVLYLKYISSGQNQQKQMCALAADAKEQSRKMQEKFDETLIGSNIEFLEYSLALTDCSE